MKKFIIIFLPLFLSFQMTNSMDQMTNPMKENGAIYEMPSDIQKEIFSFCASKERHRLGQTNKMLYKLYTSEVNQCFEDLKKEKWQCILNANNDFDNQQWLIIQTIDFNNSQEIITKHIFTCVDLDKWFLDKVITNKHVPLMHIYLTLNNNLKRNNNPLKSNQYQYLKDASFQCNSTEMFTMLIEDGNLNINSVSKAGRTIFNIMALMGKKENCKLLIDKGAKTNDELVCIVASSMDEKFHLPIIKLLLSVDHIDIDTTDYDHRTALDWAKLKKFTLIKNLLLTAININTSNGRSGLDDNMQIV